MRPFLYLFVKEAHRWEYPLGFPHGSLPFHTAQLREGTKWVTSLRVTSRHVTALIFVYYFYFIFFAHRLEPHRRCNFLVITQFFFFEICIHVHITQHVDKKWIIVNAAEWWIKEFYPLGVFNLEKGIRSHRGGVRYLNGQRKWHE